MSSSCWLRVLWLIAIFGLAVASDESRSLTVQGSYLCPYVCRRRGAKLPGGAEMEVVKIIAKELNYTLKFRRTKALGIQNGTKTGTIHQVAGGMADVGISYLPITLRTYKMLELSVPLYSAKSLLMSNNPRPLPQHFNLIKPFTWPVWAAFLALVSFAWIISAISRRFDMQKEHNFLAQAMESWLLVMGAVLQQGQNWRKKSSKGEILFALLWLMFATFIWLGYESILHASLVSIDYEKKIDTAEDVLSQNVPYYYLKGRGFNREMRLSIKKSHRQMQEIAEKEDTQLFLDKDGTVSKRTLEALYQTRGVLATMETLFPHVKQAALRKLGHNPFRLGTEVLLITHCAFIFPKGSPLRDKFDQHLKYLVSNGIVHQLFVINSPQVRDEHHDQEEDVPLGMAHFLVGFCILASGLVLASLVFAYEVRANLAGCSEKTKVKEISL